MRALLPLLFVFTATNPAADLELPAVFGDGMVLQRGAQIPIWGKADPGEEVVVTLATVSQTTTADVHGHWLVRLDELPAGGPHLLTIEGEQRIEFEDVLIGEVWLGAGQSNMGMRLEDCDDFGAERQRATHPSIRMFHEISMPASDPQWRGSGEWIRCSPERVGKFSGALYFFGKRISAELGVPVGLIDASSGGSGIEMWTSTEAQFHSPVLAEHVSALEAAFWSFDVTEYMTSYRVRHADRIGEVVRARADGRKPPRLPTNLAEIHLKNGGVGHLFNAKIAPLIPYGLRGVLWYQGEANGETAALYRHQLPLLVRDWRDRWKQPRLPFAWVQLANFETGPGPDWPEIREAQRRSLCMPDTGMVVAIDIGAARDIHPPNKLDIGLRLAAWALGSVYGFDVPTSGPLLIAHELRGSEIVASFEHADGGLVAQGADLCGFEVRGSEGGWRPAQARIEGHQVIVESAHVRVPVALRYAWAANPRCNLYNGAGLPASPFITDDIESP